MHKIENITALKGGMHIAFDRDLYEHHALVERVSIIKNTLTVIDYYNTAGAVPSREKMRDLLLGPLPSRVLPGPGSHSDSLLVRSEGTHAH